MATISQEFSSSSSSNSSPTLREWFNKLLEVKEVEQTVLNYEIFGNSTQQDVDSLKDLWFR